MRASILALVVGMLAACPVDPVVLFEIRNPCAHDVYVKPYVDLSRYYETHPDKAAKNLLRVPAHGQRGAGDSNPSLEEAVDVLVGYRSGAIRAIKVPTREGKNAVVIQLPRSLCGEALWDEALWDDQAPGGVKARD